MLKAALVPAALFAFVRSSADGHAGANDRSGPSEFLASPEAYYKYYSLPRRGSFTKLTSILEAEITDEMFLPVCSYPEGALFRHGESRYTYRVRAPESSFIK
jgi:hypothetical protein